MSGTWHFYGPAIEKIFEGSIDVDTDTFKLMLTTSAYTPNQDTDDFRNDVTNEVGASGSYAAGGATLAGGTFAYDTGSNEYRIAWTSPVFTTATITARTAVIYKSRGGASSADELVAYCTESGDVTSTAGNFTVTLPSPTLKVTVS
jgi:hypothetical protein